MVNPFDPYEKVSLRHGIWEWEKRIVLQMKKWMHILFHSLKFLQILYIGRSFIKIMYKGFHIFIEKFGHFTKNLSNDTEKHVIQRDSWLQLLMIPLLLQHCHRSRQSRLTPMHLPRIFTLFFLGNPWNDPFLTLTPKFYDENCKINVQKTIFPQTLGLGKSFHY